MKDLTFFERQPVADPGEGKSGHGSPSNLAIDFGPLQRRNKREILAKY